MFIAKTNIKTNSYIGGSPTLPSGFDLPRSKNNILLTFFFTIQFPTSHKLSGYTLSFFSATEEFDEDLTIPEMLSTDLKNATIPNGFLRTYQKLFKAYLFKTNTAQKLETINSGIKQQHLEFFPKDEGDVFGWAGLPPNWILEDETPSTYEGKNLEFLLQVKGDQTFEITDAAAPQKEMDIFGGVKDRKKRNYFFFNQNETFFSANLQTSSTTTSTLLPSRQKGTDLFSRNSAKINPPPFSWANELWIPGGKLPNGNNEEVIDATDANKPKL